MGFFLTLLRNIFSRPATPEPPKAPKNGGLTAAMERDEDDSPLFGGGASGGGGASIALPPVTAPEQAPKPPKPEPVSDETVTFREALRLILRFEGGYVNDPQDPGGETNKGITKKVYDDYRTSKGLPLRSVKDLTDEEDADIYRTQYWLAGKCDKLPPNTALVHFDTCVNSGIGQSSKILQRTVGVKDDGIIGPGTLSAVASKVNKEGDKPVAKTFLTGRRDFYNKLVVSKPPLQKFLKGWLNRVNTLEKYIDDRGTHRSPEAESKE